MNLGTDDVGILNISGGGVARAGSAVLGVSGPGGGIVNIMGAGSLWDVDTDLRVGQGGEGEISIGGGGSLNVGDDMFFNNSRCLVFLS